MINKNNNQAVNDDILFFEAAGGWDAKGKLYGLGCAGELYYENSKGSKTQRTTNADLRMQVANQQQQIDQLKSSSILTCVSSVIATCL